jgi:hypothetical protein
MAASKLERLLRTDKQKRFEYDFLKDTEKLECWEDVAWSARSTIQSRPSR